MSPSMKAVLILAFPVVSCFQISSLSIQSSHRPSLERPYRVTSQVRAMEMAFDGSAGTLIDNFFQTQPYMSAFLTCSFKATAADVLAQVRVGTTAVEEDEAPDKGVQVMVAAEENTNVDLDWQRTAGFLFYGGLYQGLFQEFLYTGLFPSWFPSETWQSVATQVGLDMAFFTVFLCLPIAYIFKTAFMSDDELGLATVEKALNKYVADVKERGLLFKYWGIWTPVQIINFTVIPTHYRVAFIAFVSFFWTFILSSTSAQGDEAQTKSGTDTE